VPHACYPWSSLDLLLLRARVLVLVSISALCGWGKRSRKIAFRKREKLGYGRARAGPMKHRAKQLIGSQHTCMRTQDCVPMVTEGDTPKESKATVASLPTDRKHVMHCTGGDAQRHLSVECSEMTGGGARLDRHALCNTASCAELLVQHCALHWKQRETQTTSWKTGFISINSIESRPWSFSSAPVGIFLATVASPSSDNGCQVILPHPICVLWMNSQRSHVSNASTPYRQRTSAPFSFLLAGRKSENIVT